MKTRHLIIPLALFLASSALAAVGAGSATVTGLATDNSTYNWTAIKVQ